MAYNFNKNCASVWPQDRPYDRSFGQPRIIECRMRDARFLVEQQRRDNCFRGAPSQHHAFPQCHRGKPRHELFCSEVFQIGGH